MPPAEIYGELEGLLRSNGVDAGLAVRLARYGSLLLDANARVNLTGARDASTLLPHLLDALTLVPFVADATSLVDVGSGGGLPGIPLALATGVRVTLVEPIAKKAAFLRETLPACGISGEALAQRAETVARDPHYREQYDVATARAVGSAPTVAELTVPLLRLGGRALLQRGAMELRERQALSDAALMLGSAIVEEFSVGGDLRVIVLEKAHPIGERFPRRNGVPEKRPLCF